MTLYQLSEDERFSTEVIGSEMFGTNFVTSYDFEFTQESREVELLGELGITVLRFPGGTITESIFAEASFNTGDWDVQSIVDENGLVTNLTTLANFFETASLINADVQLVIPTRVAFQESAGQALLGGNYGERTAIDGQYFDLLDAFIEQALFEANKNGVTIVSFEIGNEFWGSGEMNATEYGYLSALITEYLGDKYPQVAIISQIVSSANQYSPLGDRIVYLEPDGFGDFTVHNTIPTSDADFIVVTMPGAGNAVTQTQAIAEQFLLNQNALNQLDGIVEHVYFDAGFNGVDTQRDFSLNFTYNVFASAVGISDLDYFITEWSPRNPHGSPAFTNLGNANGLQYAHTTLESFFELVSNGVAGANFWPLTFGNPVIDSRVLIDTSETDLTFGGVMFQLLADYTQGLYPVLDFEVTQQIDIHGFADHDTFTMFVADRSGSSDLNSVQLDISDFVTSDSYSVTVITLSSDDGSYNEITANPEVTVQAEYTHKGDIIEIPISAWEVVVVEIQFIGGNDELPPSSTSNNRIKGTNKADILSGANQADHIQGYADNDQIYGLGGNDRIHGGGGGDVIFGNVGDDWIRGNKDNDDLFGGKGNDNILGDNGSDFLAGGSGSDNLWGGKGRDFLKGGGGSDVLNGGNSHDRLNGGRGADRLSGGAGNDTLKGGAGDDWLGGGAGVDKLYGGRGSDIFVFNSNMGVDTIMDFQSGIDLIQVTTGALGFSDLNITDTTDGVFVQSDNHTIEITGVSGSNLSAEDFLF